MKDKDRELREILENIKDKSAYSLQEGYYKQIDRAQSQIKALTGYEVECDCKKGKK